MKSPCLISRIPLLTLIEHTQESEVVRARRIEMAKWQGQFNAEGKEHGWGVHVCDDGDRAEGEFVDGLMQGWYENITDSAISDLTNHR